MEEIDYLMSVDMFNEPAILTGTRARALKIIRLILMEPGSDPLHPKMGVGLKKYRYGLNTNSDNIIEKLSSATEKQIKEYLPHLKQADISFTLTADHKLSIQITINDDIYIYEPEYEPVYPDNLK